jgi:hypothetical protein
MKKRSGSTIGCVVSDALSTKAHALDDHLERARLTGAADNAAETSTY